MSKNANIQNIDIKNYLYNYVDVANICLTYKSLYENENWGTKMLPPISAGDIKTHSNSDLLTTLYNTLQQMQNRNINKIGFCYLDVHHWRTIIFSKSTHTPNIDAYVLNSTSFPKDSDLERKDAEEILNPIYDKLREYNTNFAFNTTNSEILIYKQNGSVGCGPIALENLRRALYDNQEDRNVESQPKEMDDTNTLREKHFEIYRELKDHSLMSPEELDVLEVLSTDCEEGRKIIDKFQKFDLKTNKVCQNVETFDLDIEPISTGETMYNYSSAASAPYTDSSNTESNKDYKYLIDEIVNNLRHDPELLSQVQYALDNLTHDFMSSISEKYRALSVMELICSLDNVTQECLGSAIAIYTAENINKNPENSLHNNTSSCVSTAETTITEDQYDDLFISGLSNEELALNLGITGEY